MNCLNRFFYLLIFLTSGVFAQQDTILLREVEVADTGFSRYRSVQNPVSVPDSVRSTANVSLGGLLRFAAPVYIRENGAGGVASASFRGTTAQQTAVIWNGININSAFNGQTDFNSLYGSDFGRIDVRAGGGSVLFGSSAIGGSIHLNNELRFRQEFSNRLTLGYGSFSTARVLWQTEAGDKDWALNASVSHNRSENDYPFPDSDRHNINGRFFNTGLNLGAGYKFDSRHSLRYYGQYTSGERHFPLIVPSETKTKYQYRSSRNLLEWTYDSGRFQTRTKLAYLNEVYRYFETLSSTAPSYGEAGTAIAKIDAAYRLSPKMFLNAIVDYTHVNGRGSDVDRHRRQITSGALLFAHQPGRFGYEFGIRAESGNDYQSPLLFSGLLRYKATDFYSVKAGASRNFRMPSFNDLYWQNGGNANLRPETSFQMEIGNEFNVGGLSIAISGFYIDLDDMIQWLPGSDALWRPVNTQSVRNVGVETIGKYRFSWGSHQFELSGQYSYTNSENRETGKQLIYVPVHKSVAGIAYHFGKIGLGLDALYTGTVQTRSDGNARYELDAYVVANASLSYQPFSWLALRAEMRNLADQEYLTMVNRPLPGRHYNVSLTLKL